MAHRSRATSLRRTSQSAAASRALSVPFASSCRTLVLSRVTFFIGRCRSTRTLSLKDRRGELRIQRSHRRASTPKARRKKTCRARRRPRYHLSRRSTLPVVLPDASRSRSHRRALTPKARRKKTCRARRRPRYHPSRRSTLLLPDASRSRHVAFEAKPENLIGDRAYDSLLRLARCGAILRRSCLLFPGGRGFRRCHWIQAKKRSLNPTQSQYDYVNMSCCRARSRNAAFAATGRLFGSADTITLRARSSHARAGIILNRKPCFLPPAPESDSNNTNLNI